MSLAVLAPDRVAEAMVTRPTIHPPSTTVAQLRAFFGDDHLHMALIVDRDRLIGTVERADLAPRLSAETPASAIATLDGRTVSPDALLPEVFDEMRRDGRRRLAVTSNSSLLGLLCLKASGHGFCSDADVTNRSCTSNQTRERLIGERRRRGKTSASRPDAR